MKKTYKTYLLSFLVFVIFSNVIVAQNYVVGYLPTYSNFPNSIYNVDFSIVTHIDVAFANPNSNGDISMPNGLSTVVSVGHSNNAKVLISIAGGAVDANTYGVILGNNNTMTYFVNNLVQNVINNNLDGVDVDIEGNILDGNVVSASEYEAFVVKLGAELHNRGKLMTAALGNWFAGNVTQNAALQFDYIGIMSYDAYGSWTGPGQHSSYQKAVDDFNYWKNTKGVPANKLVIGVPFYGYGWGAYQQAWTFNDIQSSFPGTQNQDQIGSGNDVIYYNGIPTIKQKATFAKENAGGIMIWELTQDVSGANSLLQAIGDVFGQTTIGVPDNLAKGKTCVATSNEDNTNVAANATDGSYSTRWSSLYTDNQWIYVDLESNYTITQVKITWEAAMAKGYQIQTSTDAQNWSTIKTISNNTSLTNDYTGLSAKARYVRINGITRATEYGYSIFELEVYGTAISTPYSGTPIAIPGIVQAENYDLGGEKVAYHDLTATNNLGDYRTDGVDIEVCTDANGGFNIGDAEAGEWVNYSVNVTKTGYYTILARVAATSANQTFHIEIDDVNVSGTITVPNTGDWQAWQTVTVKDVSLTSGNKLMKIVMDGSMFNINYIQFASETITNIENASPFQPLQLYPNPSSGLVYYSLDNSATHQVCVYNSIGRIVIDEQRENLHSINFDQLPKGLYVVKVLQGNTQYIQNLVVN